MEDSLTSGFATATELTHSMDCRSLDKQWCISLHCLWFPEHAGILCSVTCSHQTNTMPRLAWQSQARQDYTSAAPWRRGRRKWQPTPVVLPGKFHGQRNLAATVHGVAESATTEHVSTAPPAWLFPSNPWLEGELKINLI